MASGKLKLFGTDGVKGRANLFPMSVEIALALGRANGKTLKDQPGKHRIVIGKRHTSLLLYV